MPTEIIKIDISNIDISLIKKASEVILSGGLVVFPTETVYGLGADALNIDAVKNIYKAKGRPSDNPLIVHIYSEKQLYSIAENIDEKAKLLIKKFWPGPLSIIFKKQVSIPDEVTGGSDTIAVRMPKHPVASILLQYADVPIAAPSANSSGRPSGTLIKDIEDELIGKVDIIIDSGVADYGIESTVIDMTEDTPVIMRYGAVSVDDIVSVIGDVKLSDSLSLSTKNVQISSVRSPGTKYRHYAPNAEIIMLEGSISNISDKIDEIIKNNNDKRFSIISFTKDISHQNLFNYYIGNNDIEVAKKLFSSLRYLDKISDIIMVMPIPSTEGIWLSIKDRLLKASEYNIIIC